MSSTALQKLLQAHAFNPSPREQELRNLHVPFDEIVGVPRCERVLADALRRGERVGLIGPSGSGKSSVTEHVLGGAYVQDLAPIRVRVGLEPESVVLDPREFIRHLVRTVAKSVEATVKRERRQVKRLAREVTQPETKRAVKVGVGGGVPWLTGNLAVELGSVVASMGPSGEDALEGAQLILDVITDSGLRPVLVLDDTDHWLVRPGLSDPDERIAAFFGPIVRVIVERLPTAAAVVAVHDTYLHHPSYTDATAFLETRLTVPPLPDATSVGRILGHRVARVVGFSRTSPGLDDVISPAGLDRLFQNYAASGRSLRGVLRVAHGALVHAGDSGAALIDIAHVDLAIAD
jgi:hypothetical protein